jgi:hypothetical protein
MTDEMMALRGLMEKSADADILREMIGFAAQRLMELEVGGLTGAVHGEKNPDRLVQRNISQALSQTIKSAEKGAAKPRNQPPTKPTQWVMTPGRR